jgi:hypothetical protein
VQVLFDHSSSLDRVVPVRCCHCNIERDTHRCRAFADHGAPSDRVNTVHGRKIAVEADWHFSQWCKAPFATILWLVQPKTIVKLAKVPAHRRAGQGQPTLLSLSRPMILGLLLVTSCAPDGIAYSVLTHEAIIDAAWNDGIVALLLNRFPNATPEELLRAHAYAYGGAIIQDLGY